jgi:hypothetical protein
LPPFPTTDANTFQDISDTQQDQLLADFAAASLTHERVVTGEAHDDKA